MCVCVCVCADLKFCSHYRPCRNGATCLNTGLGSYKCVCPPNFTGPRCEIDLDGCPYVPCLNDGICIVRLSIFIITDVYSLQLVCEVFNRFSVTTVLLDRVWAMVMMMTMRISQVTDAHCESILLFLSVSSSVSPHLTSQCGHADICWHTHTDSHYYGAVPAFAFFSTMVLNREIFYTEEVNKMVLSIRSQYRCCCLFYDFLWLLLLFYYY